MDEIELHENINLMREELNDVVNERMRMVLLRMVACIEFMQEQITELQEGAEEIE